MGDDGNTIAIPMVYLNYSPWKVKNVEWRQTSASLVASMYVTSLTTRWPPLMGYL